MKDISRKIDNYKILFCFRILKSILISFVDSFLILYFITLSDNNILPFGIYKLVAVTTIFLSIFLLRNICKTKKRINLLRIGIILDFVYFITIIILKEKVVNYMFFLGLLYGLEEGFYYSVYNMFESNGISNSKRAKYTGEYTSVKSILSILFPLIFGSLIQTTGFLKSISIVLIIIVFRIFLSFIFKDENFTKTKKTNLRGYYNKIKDNKVIKSVYLTSFFDGLTYSDGAFKNLITIYIIKVFNDGFSLGIFTSIFSFISSIIGLLFARYIKKKNYENILKISMIFTISSLVLMVIYCNAFTIILFNFFQTISLGFSDLINANNKSNSSNLQEIKKDYKVEYFLGIEFSLFVGRYISYVLFIAMAYNKIEYFIPIFIIFLCFYTFNSINLQKSIRHGSS